MNFSVNSTKLMTALKRLSALVPSKPMLPMHGAIKISSVETSKVSFLACNPHMSAQADVDSDSTCQFEIGLNAAVFTEVVSVLPKDTKVVFNTVSGDEKCVLISAGKSIFRLNLLTQDVFAPAKNYESLPFIPLDVRQFVDNLKSVSFCRNSKSDKEVFSAVCVNTEHFVSTDGYRLSFVPNTLLKIPGNLILSGESTDRIQKLFDKVSGSGQFFGTPSDVILSMGGTTVTCRLMVDRFPRYQSVIPTGEHLTCTVNRVLALEALSRAMAVAGESSSKQVEIGFEPGAIQLYSVDESAGAVTDTIPCEMSGMSAPILLSGVYLIEALRRYDAEKVVFEVRGDSSPFVITDGAHVNVIQPIRRGAM